MLEARSASEYAAALARLLPQGPVWEAPPGSHLAELLAGLAEAFAAMHARQLDLVEEADPRTTTELLEAWEAFAGLPEECTESAEPLSTELRRLLLHAKLTGTGGQTAAYYIALAATLGLVITIEEPISPFRVGAGRAGDPLYGTDWAYAWIVHVDLDDAELVEFRAGIGRAGEPLRSWGNVALECLIEKLRPAHTIPVFSYT